MHRRQQIAYLNRLLLSDMPEYREQAAAVPADEASQRRLLRALMNVRPPLPLSPAFLEVQDAPEPAHEGAGAQAQVLRAEGERILSRIRPDDVVVALAIEGKTYDSVGFAKHLEQIAQRGRVVFVIGGSLGLSPEVYARANERLSFSTLTFPHQMMRVVFLEQLYRACRIQSGERYHK